MLSIFSCVCSLLYMNRIISSVQPLSRVWLCDPMNRSMPGLPVHHKLPEFTQTHVHRVGDAIQPSHPLSSLSLPAQNPPQHQGLFQWVNSSHQVANWSFSFSISPPNEHPGLISFRMDWLDLLVVQGTLKSLLQHHSSKASIFQCSAFFRVQLSHPYMTTGKTIALVRRTFAGKVMSLLFNMPSRLVIAFLPRSNHLLISWLKSPSVVIFEAQRNNVSHCFHYFPIYLPWSGGTTCHGLSFLNAECQVSFFTLLFCFHQEALQFFFPFWHNGGVVCLSEVIDISPSNHDSSLCFI